MKRWTRIAGIAAIGTAAALSLTAFKGGGHCRKGASDADVQKFATYAFDEALDGLNVTDAQRARLSPLKDSLVKQGLELRTDKQEMKAQAMAALKSDQPDAAQLHASVDQQVEALREMAHSAVDSMVEAHSVLTPEQRTALLEKLERRHSW